MKLLNRKRGKKSHDDSIITDKFSGNDIDIDITDSAVNSLNKEKESEIVLSSDEDIEVVPDVWLPGLEERVLKESLPTLNVGQWLNDEIINTSFQIIAEEAQNVDIDIACLFDYQIRSVTRAIPSTLWHLNRRLDQYHKIIVPAHVSGGHWIFIGVDVSSRQISIMDSLNKCIPSRMLQVNYSYAKLVQEVLIRNATLHNLTGFDTWNITEIFTAPKQYNLIDCGMFAILYAESYVYNTAMSFSQADIPAIRGHAKNIFENFVPTQNKRFLLANNDHIGQSKTLPIVQINVPSEKGYTSVPMNFKNIFNDVNRQRNNILNVSDEEESLTSENAKEIMADNTNEYDPTKKTADRLRIKQKRDNMDDKEKAASNKKDADRMKKSRNNLVDDEKEMAKKLMQIERKRSEIS